REGAAEQEVPDNGGQGRRYQAEPEQCRQDAGGSSEGQAAECGQQEAVAPKRRLEPDESDHRQHQEHSDVRPAARADATQADPVSCHGHPVSPLTSAGRSFRSPIVMTVSPATDEIFGSEPSTTWKATWLVSCPNSDWMLRNSA